MTKRAVILLGAGAPLAWGGPSTSKITSELFENKEYLTTTKQNLAEYIRDVLAKFYDHNPSDIHFEYIINAMESISDYLYEVVSKGGPPQFIGSKPAWFTLTNTYNAIENFKFQLINDNSDMGALFNLAKSEDSPQQVDKKAHKRFYIMHAIEHYLSIIRNCIGRYDYPDAICKFPKANRELINFYLSLKEQGYVVRFYTTNYDDLVPNIFDIMGQKPLYRGFDLDSNKRYFPNIKNILVAENIDCYYNLHGSIYWETDTNEKFEPNFTYKPGIHALTPMAHGEYTNPSERTIIYNIITGFNKLQKVSVEPLKAFFTSLSTDSIKADLIATIGYSYGDTHINRSLSYGVKESNAKFLHITRSDNFFGSTDFINMQRHTINRKNYQDFSNKKPWLIVNDETSRIYTEGFSDFLEKQNWKDLHGWL